MKSAQITGITGQDGSYLAEFLLEKGYEVHGIVRRVAFEDPVHRLERIHHLLDRILLHPASLESYASIFRVVEHVRPDECYHLAAQSFVSYSFDDEFSTININVNGTHYVLSAIKEKAPGCRFYFAGSSEMFDNAPESPQNENTAFYPRPPYGISKVAIFHLPFLCSCGGEQLVLERIRRLLAPGHELACFAPFIDREGCYPDARETAEVQPLLPAPGWIGE